MLSTRLVRLIETHAEELTRGVVAHLKSHPRTPSYQTFTDAELHDCAYRVYKNLGAWLSGTREEDIRKAYEETGGRRCAEGIPLSEVIYALIVTKNHLLDFAKTSTEGGTTLEVFGERELTAMVSRFFDYAIYYAALGYEKASHGAGKMVARTAHSAAPRRG